MCSQIAVRFCIQLSIVASRRVNCVFSNPFALQEESGTLWYDVMRSPLQLTNIADLHVLCRCKRCRITNNSSGGTDESRSTPYLNDARMISKYIRNDEVHCTSTSFTEDVINQCLENFNFNLGTPTQFAVASSKVDFCINLLTRAPKHIGFCSHFGARARAQRTRACGHKMLRKKEHASN